MKLEIQADKHEIEALYDVVTQILSQLKIVLKPESYLGIFSIIFQIDEYMHKNDKKWCNSGTCALEDNRKNLQKLIENIKKNSSIH